MTDIIINGRGFKLRYSAPEVVFRLPWVMSCRVDGEGQSSAKEFFEGLTGARVEVAFSVSALGLVNGSAFFNATPLLVNGDVALQFEGTSQLRQLLTWPDTLPADTQVAHETTVLKLETEVAATACGLCPPGVDVEIRRTERVRGLEPGKLVIQMWVGGNPW